VWGDNISSFIDDIENANKYLDNSPQANYIIRYMKEIGAKYILIEEKYVDKDYLIDFSRYFSRSFGDKKWDTIRVHFFSETLGEKNKLENDFFSFDITAIKKNYKGFAIVKPVKNMLWVLS